MKQLLYTIFLVIYCFTESRSSEECEVVKIGESEKQSHSENSAVIESTKSEHLDICVYNSGISLIRDTRILHLKRGMNVVYIYDISPLLELSSVKLSCTEFTHNINVLSYELIKKQSSKSELLKSSIGNHVFFLNNAKNECRGILNDVLFDTSTNSHTLVIYSGGRIMFIPSEDCRCTSLSQGIVRQNALKSHIYSEEDVNVTLELQYVTSGITWKPEYRLDIHENENTARISTNAMLKNSIDWDIKEANVIFGTSAPSLDANDHNGLYTSSNFKCPEVLSLKRGSSTVIAMDKCVSLPTSHGHMIVMPAKRHTDKKLKVGSVVTFDISHFDRVNCIKSDDTMGVYATSRKDDQRFLGSQCLRGIIGDGEAAVCVGESGSVTASIAYFDVRNITSKICEMSISVRVTNNKAEKATVYVADKQNNARLIKESHKRITQDSLVWKLTVDGKTSLDLFYKLRIEKNDESITISR